MNANTWTLITFAALAAASIGLFGGLLLAFLPSIAAIPAVASVPVSLALAAEASRKAHQTR